MIAIQILAILFALWMTYFTSLHFRRREFAFSEFVMWEVLWVGLIVVVVFPASVHFLLTTFKINRTFDLVVIVAIMALFASSFRTTVLLKRVQRKMEDVIRREALEEARKREQ